jgi:hypothetical protein
MSLRNVAGAQGLINAGVTSEKAAAGNFTISIAKDDVNNPRFGNATLDTVLVHEGQHLEFNSKIVAGLASGDPKKRFDVTYAFNEAQSQIQAAYYMERRGGPHHQLGLSLGLLQQQGGKVSVPAGQIRANVARHYGADANKSVLKALLQTGLRPR